MPDMGNIDNKLHVDVVTEILNHGLMLMFNAVTRGTIKT